MTAIEIPPGDDSKQGDGAPAPALAVPRSRKYQLEMFERSMQGNVIVVMDTGSGKTHIAFLRIQAELTTCGAKRIWFMAPTVALCTQQHDFFVSQFQNSVRTRLLIGPDNVDRWSDQHTWDDALEGVRLVVSTHEVLKGALNHGFVKIEELALLVFDEAHHCARGHPANKIMQLWYHPAKKLPGASVPHILGLTASPIMRSKMTELRLIEANLDAVTITPKLHRQDLFKHVHRPKLLVLDHDPPDQDTPTLSRALVLLRQSSDAAFATPQCQRLSTGNTPKTLSEHVAVQLERFVRDSETIYAELGPWAADYFITETISTLRYTPGYIQGMLRGGHDVKKSLLRFLDQPALAAVQASLSHHHHASMAVSAKMQTLVGFLARQDHTTCSSLLFAQQRATVSVLRRLLEVHPDIKGKFTCATFVGTSGNSKRKYILTELLDLKEQRNTISEFRARRKNLVIATDVLEEGIDVAACNLVVCFDMSLTLKSFIQRRGRARAPDSQFAIMLPRQCSTSNGKITKFEALEEELVKSYLEETKNLKLQSQKEDVYEENLDTLHVPATGATIGADDAIAHLNHFCTQLPHDRNVILPTYSADQNPSTELFTATVTLPNCVTSDVRRTAGRFPWRTERAAKKDAALQAYKALYRAGLVNEHLLPLTRDQDLASSHAPPHITSIRPAFNPWPNLAAAWDTPDTHRVLITFANQDGTETKDIAMTMTVPLGIPKIPQLTLYWDAATTLTARFSNPARVAAFGANDLNLSRQATHVLRRATRADGLKDSGDDYIALFVPPSHVGQLGPWLEANRGREPALDSYRRAPTSTPRGLIRDGRFGAPRTFGAWSRLVDDNQETVQVSCLSLVKRRNFTVPRIAEKQKDKPPPKAHAFDAQDCMVDRLPRELAQFSLFLPSVLQHIQSTLVAEQLCATILKRAAFRDIRNVITAITSAKCQWHTDYQRFEFLGDSVLKFIVSCQLFTENPKWPEGYLAMRKDNLVSNHSLQRAALAAGLEEYILTEPVASRNWSPMLVAEAISEQMLDGKRQVSTKLLADVVESLIGAAYIEHGFAGARAVANILLPQIHPAAPARWPEIPQLDGQGHEDLRDLERLLGYTFRNKGILLQAVTHSSQESSISTESYQRLEFLGDAVLDMLVVQMLTPAGHEMPPQGVMTQTKAALVNGDFLGFLCLRHTITREDKEIRETKKNQFETLTRTREVQIWHFMRFHGVEVHSNRVATRERYGRLYAEIQTALETGSRFPWVPLARLGANKFFSDLIEAAIGAILVDSEGDLEQCRRFVERLGIHRVAERALAGELTVRHPKSRATELAALLHSQSNGFEAMTFPNDGKIGGYEGGEEGGAENVEAAGEDGAEESASDIDEAVTFGCIIKVGGREIVRVNERCLTRNEAIVVACELAVEKMEAMNARGENLRAEESAETAETADARASVVSGVVDVDSVDREGGMSDDEMGM